MARYAVAPESAIDINNTTYQILCQMLSVGSGALGGLLSEDLAAIVGVMAGAAGAVLFGGLINTVL